MTTDRDADQYLIRKSGAWYRPNSAGYTTNIAEAGRYTLAEAEAITHPNGPDGPRDNMSYELAPPSPAPAESGAVAWQGVAPDGRVEITRVMATAHEWIASDWFVRPLYANPPATSASMGRGRVTVKALEWESIEGTSMWAHQKWASSVQFWWTYRITLRADRMHQVRLEGINNVNIDLGCFATWDDAKAAAQSDYETRILAALDYHEPAPGDTQPALPSTAETQAPERVTEIMVEPFTDSIVLLMTGEGETLSAILDTSYAVELRDKLSAAIDSPPDHGGGEGWVLVPREPTPQMVAATAPHMELDGNDYAVAMAALDHLPRNDHPDIADVLAQVSRDYRSMIAAAPSLPNQESEDGR